ncbi:hypothetical protein BDV96DRAFT_581966 [Lophiotrema nucula]|uniref:Uncharacterized protein n=1 Tax=Lophiotrema nucula TaxID=690887 RepID=A0A6A5Z0N2_9PLEO|nr:hypothetical protein BDV96DRAFT_581966 [Lophiotrema nucula]
MPQAQVTSRSQGGLFQCGTCSQSYSRLDHLARHVRSHTQEKPYGCEICNKHFSRVDLLRRHALLHNTAAQDAPAKRRRIDSSTAAPVRVSKACEACAEHHLKCEDGKPCRRCCTKNIACVLVPRTTLAESHECSPSAEQQPQLGLELDTALQGQHNPQSGTSTGSHFSDAPPSDEENNIDHAVLESAIASQQVIPTALPHLPSPPAPPFEAQQNGSFHHDEEGQNHVNGQQSQYEPGERPAAVDFLAPGNWASGTVTPTGLVGYCGEPDLDFSAIDLSFLNTYNTQVPFDFQDLVFPIPPPDTAPSTQNCSSANDNATPTSLRGLLPHTIWRYVPVAGVHAYTEQADLSLPAQDQIVTSPESFGVSSRRATVERLDAGTRDKLLVILLGQVKRHILPALSALPSVKLLDRLIQFFLAGPIPTASSWIHTATFRPKEAKPELLLSMAAAGAVLTPDRSLRKLGFAMQEVVRNHMVDVFESDNTLVRDLEMSQAFMLHLEIGLWSGSSRKIEIAESFQQPLLSMLRRGGRFRRSSYPIFAFGPEDEGVVLERKWRAWAEQESFKRLVYHILGHNAQLSVSLLIGPLMSYSELDLPLPEPQELWSATSAVAWKAAYQSVFEDRATRLPSLTECVASPDLLQVCKPTVDYEMSCESFLYALWGMVWEYRKLARLFCARPTKTNSWDSPIALTSRYQDLVNTFDYYRMTCGNESTLLLELILMHLHMSLEEVQFFCGLDAPEEISRVHESLKKWVHSKNSRLAVWHAGQLVRATRKLPPLFLRDFYAISLFHASLTFWAYGLASRMFGGGQDSQTTSLLTPHQQVVHLDDEETAATYRFISSARGVPSLRGNQPSSSVTFLSDLTAVMTVIMEAMEQGDRDSAMPKSPLVENLLNVMGRLKETRISDSNAVL